jgi:hypothetical protein
MSGPRSVAYESFGLVCSAGRAWRPMQSHTAVDQRMKPMASVDADTDMRA